MRAPEKRTLLGTIFARLERRKETIGLVVTIVVLALCGFALQRLLAEMRLAEVRAAITALPTFAILASLAFTAASFATLVGYDWSALRYVGQKLPLRVMALASFCGYAIGNTVGLSLLTGGSVRFRIYTAAGMSSEDVGRVTLFCVVAFGFGVSAVSGVGVLLRPNLLSSTLNVPVAALQIVSLMLVAGVAGFVVLCALRRTLRWRNVSLPLPAPALVAGQLAISAVDLGLAAAALYVLLPDKAGLSFFGFLPLFCVAIVAGIMSHVPGGLGVFEAVIIFALGDKTAQGPLVGALVIYRLIYYILPLLLAGSFLGLNELRQTMPATRAAFQRVFDLTGAIVPTAASVLVVLSGIILLASIATPMDATRASLIASIFPLWIIEVSHLLGGLVATGLILLAPALQQRSNAAYSLALVYLFLGIVFSLTKGFDFEEAILLTVMGLLLLPYHHEFYRRTSLRFTPGWVAAIVCILGAAFWLMLFAYKHIDYDHTLWFQFAFQGDAPRSLRALFTAVLAVFGFALLRLLRPPPRQTAVASEDDLVAARRIALKQDRADAQLVLLGDKSLLFSNSGSSFLMYGRQGGSWIGLFDPIGLASETGELIWRFRELCDHERARPAFYQIRPDNLPLYVDAGLTLTKLGEEARVHLPDFDLKKLSSTKLLHAVNCCIRDGLTFRVFSRYEVVGIVDQLSEVSAAWRSLKDVREKAFSMGSFSPAYVANFDVAVVLMGERIIAFATLMTTELRIEAGLDLMRHVPDVPNLTIQFLITSAILEMKKRGLRWFNLGMAPPSGLEQRDPQPLCHRSEGTVFEHEEQFYNFHGFRQIQEKFNPRWEPRYLATPGGIDPVIVVADISTLIAGGSTSGMVRKSS
jgi:phosphatidylglycerol lysyltransferase